MPQKSAFICHTSSDHGFARRRCDMLESRGIGGWIAPRDIQPGKIVFPIRVREVRPSKSIELYVGASQWIDDFKPPLGSSLDCRPGLAYDLYSAGCTIFALNYCSDPPNTTERRPFNRAMTLQNANDELDHIFPGRTALDPARRYPDARSA